MNQQNLRLGAIFQKGRTVDPLLSLRRAAFAALLGLAPAGSADAQSRAPDDLITVEVATVGIGLVSRVPVVILHDPVSDKTMPVWIGSSEADAIARSLFGVKSPRPMTHDLLAEMIKAMQGRVAEVLINDSKGGVYYGRIHILTREKKIVDVDSRPSDAVALALRTGAPIRVKHDLLASAPEVTVRADSETPDFARALGLTVVSPTPETRKLFSLPNRDGVVVVESLDEADEAGLRRGDLIIEVNGKTMKTAQAFWDAVRAGRASGPVRIKYWRGGKETEVRVAPRRPKGEQAPAVPA